MSHLSICAQASLQILLHKLSLPRPAVTCTMPNPQTLVCPVSQPSSQWHEKLKGLRLAHYSFPTSCSATVPSPLLHRTLALCPSDKVRTAQTMLLMNPQEQCPVLISTSSYTGAAPYLPVKAHKAFHTPSPSDNK